MRRLLPLIALALAGCGSAQPATQEPPPFAVETPDVAITPTATPEAEDAAPEGRYLTARLTKRTWLRATPDGRRVATVGLKTEFGSPRVFSVTAQRDGWLRVVATEQRNGEPAWIPEDAAELGATDMSIVIDRSARRLTLMDGEEAVRRLPVAVGRPGTPTPLGRFGVTDKLRPQKPDSPYGCCAVALTGHQTKLVPGWPGGDRLAVHATPSTWSIGKEASLGCVRAHTEDMRVLMKRVPLGAPVFIKA